MANPEHLAKLREGVGAWNAWRARDPGVRPNLADADLSDLNLAHIDLSRSDAVRANLSRTVLAGAVLKWTDLFRANLEGATLENAIALGANFQDAALAGANLGAVLTRVSFNGPSFGAAKFHGATLGRTVFAAADLSGVTGLESVTHVAPSSVGIDTIAYSQGKIPEAFLRGCGVPDQFVAYARSLVANPIEFYSAFLSYSKDDHDFVARLRADLQARSVRVWFAPEDLKIGGRFAELIEESIRVYDKLMIVLSRSSVASRWVEREVNAALEREDRDSRTVLFPIRIDDAVKETTAPWAADIRRSRYIGDFSRWKEHDAYAKALERLLRDLKTDKP